MDVGSAERLPGCHPCSYPSALQRLMDLERFHFHKAEMFQQLSRDPSFDTRFLPQNRRRACFPDFADSIRAPGSGS